MNGYAAKGEQEPDEVRFRGLPTLDDEMVVAEGAPVATVLRHGAAFTAADLAVATFPEPKWAVRDLLAEGVNLLVGAPKLGKSWMAYDIALAVASGGRVLGSIDVDPGDVLYLALEDTPRRLQRRMQILGGAASPRLTFLTEWPGNDAGFEFMTEWLAAQAAPRLVIVDVLQKLRPSVGANQNAYSADYEAMAPLIALARRYSVCFLVVHHTRKASADDFLDTVSGTNGIAGSADATLVLTRARNAADGTLSVTGRDVEERSYALGFQGGKWSLLDGTAADYDLSDIRRTALDALRQHGPMRPKALAAVIAHDYEATKKLCQRMAVGGQVTTDGAGRYSVVPDPLSPESPESLTLPIEGHQGHEGQG